MNVSKFFARPRTAAAEMQKEFVPFEEIKRRSSVAAELARKVTFKKNQSWASWIGKVFVDEVGKVSGSWVGRNFAYKPITVKSTDDLLGKVLRLKVARAFSTYLEGEVIEQIH